MNYKNLNLLLTPEFQMFPKLLAQRHPPGTTKAQLVNMPKAYSSPKPQPLPGLLVQVDGTSILLVLLDRNLGVIVLLLFFPFLFCVQSITPSCLLSSLNISFIQLFLFQWPPSQIRPFCCTISRSYKVVSQSHSCFLRFCFS